MANSKIGFSYYSTDTNRYQDIKIKRLKKEHGCVGLSVYDYILCEVYRVRGYYLEWNNDILFDISEYLGLEENNVTNVVKTCCQIELFSANMLGSKSIQKRYLDMCLRAKRKEDIILEEYDIITEESTKLPEESAKIHEVCPKVKESKVKDSKVDKNKLYKNSLLSEIEISDFPFLNSEYLKIAKSFYSLFEKNLLDAGATTANLKKAKGVWIDEIRFIIEIDGYTIKDLQEVYAFLQKDDFWKMNIVSTNKLRKQMDKIKLQSKQPPKQTQHPFAQKLPQTYEQF